MVELLQRFLGRTSSLKIGTVFLTNIEALSVQICGRTTGHHLEHYRVTKAECLDLPEKLPDEVYDIELKEPTLYKELHKSSTVEELGILAENPLARMTKLRQVCSGFLNDGETTHELKCEKINVLEEFLDGWEKKLVVFCEFKH